MRCSVVSLRWRIQGNRKKEIIATTSTAMGQIFGKEKPLKEVLRENKRMINRAVRELDREKAALEREEKRLQIEIKKAAKENQMGAVKIMAKVCLFCADYFVGGLAAEMVGFGGSCGVIFVRDSSTGGGGEDEKIKMETEWARVWCIPSIGPLVLLLAE